MKEEFVDKKVKITTKKGETIIATILWWLQEPEEEEIIVLDNHRYISIINIDRIEAA